MELHSITLADDLDEEQPSVSRSVLAVRVAGGTFFLGSITLSVLAWQTGALGWLLAYIGYSVLFVSAMGYITGIPRRKQRLLDREWARRFRELAIRDELTGLFNRRYFNDQLAALIGRCQDQRSPVTVALIDLNGLKAINDTFGHHTGDIALRTLAECIERSVGQLGLAARTGGDEFGVIFPGLGPAEAAQVLSATRKMLNATPLNPGLAGEPLPRLSAAVGLATLDDFGDADRILRAADAALYANKRELGQLHDRRKAS